VFVETLSVTLFCPNPAVRSILVPPISSITPVPLLRLVPLQGTSALRADSSFPLTGVSGRALRADSRSGGSALRAGSSADQPDDRAQERAARRVTGENRLAARLDPTDARWVLALRVAADIEGGRAAILRPERRQRLMSLATRLGLRQFDAGLVIAIVQDGARTGDTAGGIIAAPVESRLRLVHAPDAPPADGLGGAGWLPASFIVALLAGAIFFALVTWLMR
jgi:hypothetical protein